MKTIFIVGLLAIFVATGGCQTAWAAVYYVDSAAPAGGDGSYATPWNKLSAISGLTTSDDVYLKCGSLFDQQTISVDWGGTEADRGVLGAYYDGPTIGVNGDGKPIIRGVCDDSNSGNNYPPATSFLAMVTISNTYQTVQDIRIEESGQYGVKPVATGNHFTIQRMDIDGTYWGGIYISGADFGLISQNRVRDVARKVLSDGLPWAGGIAGPYSTNNTIEGNYVEGSHGEGIGAGDRSVVRFNVVLNCRSVGIYCDGCDATSIYGNLYLQTTNLSYDGGKTGWGARAYEINIEPGNNKRKDTSDIRFMYNIAIGALAGMKFVLTSTDGAAWNHVTVSNNGFFDCRKNIDINDSQTDITDQTVTIRNNLSVTRHASSTHGSIIGSINPATWTITHQAWEGGAPRQENLAGSSYATTDPAIGWAGAFHGVVTALTDLEMTDLIPTIYSAGVDLGVGFDNGIDPDRTDWIRPDPTTSPIVVALTNQDNHGATWEIGPFVDTVDLLDGGPVDGGLADAVPDLSDSRPADSALQQEIRPSKGNGCDCDLGEQSGSGVSLLILIAWFCWLGARRSASIR